MLLLLLSVAMGQDLEGKDLDGLRARGLEVAPYVELGASFTPNVYRTPGNPKPAAGALIRPGLTLRWQTPDVDLSLAGQAARRQVLFVLGDDVSAWQLSRTDLHLKGELLLRPDKPLSGVIREQAGRAHSLAPSSLAGASGKGLAVRQDTLTQAGLRYQPGRGALSVELLGRAHVEQHNVSVGPNYLQPTSSITRLSGGGDLQARWAFFPRTDLVLNGRIEGYSWTGAQLPGWGWRANAGIYGRVDYPLVINLAAGFAQLRDGGVASTTPLDGVTVKVAGIWNPTRTQNIRLAYEKDLEDSWYAPHLHFHRASLRYGVAPGKRTQLNTQGSVRWEQARGLAYQDVVVSSSIKVDYALTRQLSMGAQLGLDWRLQAGWDVPIGAWIHLGW